MCWRSNKKSRKPSRIIGSSPYFYFRFCLQCCVEARFDRDSSTMASLSPVTARRPVGEARFVRAILLPVRTPSLRRVFRDFDHAECSFTSRPFHFASSTLSMTICLYCWHVFSSLSFYTHTLGWNLLCQLFVSLNHMSITNSLCFGTQSSLEITLTLWTLALSSCRTMISTQNNGTLNKY